MSTFASYITPGPRRALDYARRLLVGITPANAARLPNLGGKIIQTNHAAFCLGHLALYPSRVITYLGRDPQPVAVPENWNALFGSGAACVDDATGQHYPALDEITQRFFDGYTAAIAAVEKADETAFAQPIPDERYAQIFGTIGALATMMLGQHVSLHLGQLSAWRRCMGLGPAT